MAAVAVAVEVVGVVVMIVVVVAGVMVLVVTVGGNGVSGDSGCVSGGRVSHNRTDDDVAGAIYQKSIPTRVHCDIVRTLVIIITDTIIVMNMNITIITICSVSVPSVTSTVIATFCILIALAW